MSEFNVGLNQSQSPAVVSAGQLDALMARLDALENAKREAEEEAARVQWAKAHEGVTSSLANLRDHLVARQAQHYDLHGPVFSKPTSLAQSLAGRMEPDEGSVVRPPSESEARLLHSQVLGLAKGRDHLELSYLPELADEVLSAVLAVAGAEN